jgi:hypothetical protein
MPRDTLAFIGYTDPDSGISGAGTEYSGNAVISQTVINWDFAAGVPVNYVNTFAGDLALTIGSGSSVDATVPDVPPMCPLKIEIGDDLSEVAFPSVVSAALTITAQLQAHANSSTIVGTECWMAQEAGSIDWTLALVVENHDRASPLPAIGDQVRLRLFTSATEFWLLEWGVVKEYTGITVDNESNAIISATIIIEMDGFKKSDGSTGTITFPDTTEWWPTGLS